MLSAVPSASGPPLSSRNPEFAGTLILRSEIVRTSGCSQIQGSIAMVDVPINNRHWVSRGVGIAGAMTRY